MTGKMGTLELIFWAIVGTIVFGGFFVLGLYWLTNVPITSF